MAGNSIGIDWFLVCLRRVTNNRIFVGPSKAQQALHPRPTTHQYERIGSSRSRSADQFFRPKIGENVRRYTGGVNAIACGYGADETTAARIGLSAADPKFPAGLRI
jgi:hypothetical protein